MSTDTEFRNEVNEVNELLLDEMEDKLEGFVDNEVNLSVALKATISILEAKAKHRGYGKTEEKRDEQVIRIENYIPLFDAEK